MILNKKLGLDPDYQPTFDDMGLDKPMVSDVEGVDIETLYHVIRKSPEVVAAINAIVEDILSDGYKLEGSKKPIGDVEEFLKNSKFKKILANALFDLITTGNAYILKLSVSEARIKSLLDRLSQNKVIQKFGWKRKEVRNKTFFELKQKGTFKPKDLQNLKSSTVRIDYDEHGTVEGYRQTVNQQTVFFKPNEVTHLSLINLGGSVYGFTPLESLLSDIASLIFAKDYAGKFFENNGIPNLLINLPEAMGEEDRNYQVLKQALKEGKKKDNKWRAIITTGPTDVNQIEPFSKEMRFVDLVKHLTEVVFMALGVPPQRVNPTSAEGTQNELKAYEGYFKKINFLQQIVEEPINELLSEFGKVELSFNRSYKIDELREANIVAILADRRLITEEEARRMMGMEEEKEGTEINEVGQDRDTSALEGEDTRKPEEEELSEPQNREDKPDNKISGKTITRLSKKYNGAMEVAWVDFKSLVERLMPFQDANVLYQETNNQLVLYFHDGKWAYKCKLNKEDIDIEEFKYYLINATRLISDEVDFTSEDI